MPVPDQVAQGENYDFSQTLGVGVDTDVTGFTYQVDVKQFPDSVPAISKPITDINGSTIQGTLTSAETATLSVGLWYVIVTSTDTNEEIQTTNRIQITKTWV